MCRWEVERAAQAVFVLSGEETTYDARNRPGRSSSGARESDVEHDQASIRDGAATFATGRGEGACDEMEVRSKRQETTGRGEGAMVSLSLCTKWLGVELTSLPRTMPLREHKRNATPFLESFQCILSCRLAGPIY